MSRLASPYLGVVHHELVRTAHFVNSIQQAIAAGDLIEPPSMLGDELTVLPVGVGGHDQPGQGELGPAVGTTDDLMLSLQGLNLPSSLQAEMREVIDCEEGTIERRGVSDFRGVRFAVLESRSKRGLLSRSTRGLLSLQAVHHMVAIAIFDKRGSKTEVMGSSAGYICVGVFRDSAPNPAKLTAAVQGSFLRFQRGTYMSKLALQRLGRRIDVENMLTELCARTFPIENCSVTVPALDQKTVWQCKVMLIAAKANLQKHHVCVSLDGGGSRGFVAATTVKKVFENVLPAGDGAECPWGTVDRYYGTSSGAIIAAALHIGICPVRELDEVFKLQAQQIFGNSWFGKTRSLVYSRTKHSAKMLDKLLLRHFQFALQTLQDIAAGPDAPSPGARGTLVAGLLSSLTTHSTIVSGIEQQAERYCSERAIAVAPDSTPLAKVQPQANIGPSGQTLGDVLRSSVAAPAYLPEHSAVYENGHHHRLADGGLENNNPSLSCFVDVAALQQRVSGGGEQSSAILISVGTGSCSPALGNGNLLRGGLRMLATTHNPHFMITHALDMGYKRLYYDRLQPHFATSVSLDTTEDADFVIMANAVAQEAEGRLAEQFVNARKNLKRVTRHRQAPYSRDSGRAQAPPILALHHALLAAIHVHFFEI